MDDVCGDMAALLAHLLVEGTETVHIVALQVILCLFRTHTAPPEPSPTCSLWSSATLLRAVRAVDREAARCMTLRGADLASYVVDMSLSPNV